MLNELVLDVDMMMLMRGSVWVGVHRNRLPVFATQKQALDGVTELCG